MKQQFNSDFIKRKGGTENSAFCTCFDFFSFAEKSLYRFTKNIPY